MKFKRMLFPLAFLTAISGHAFADTVSGGTVHFSGQVVESGCALAANSIDQTVTLGQVRANHFTAADMPGDAKQTFNIELKDCDTAVATNVALHFSGDEVPGKVGILENQSRGTTAATGVGIQLYDTDGSLLDLNTDSSNVSLMSGDNILTFAADYISTDAIVTAGDVTATTTFDITYS